MEILAMYETAFGQQTNEQKSSITFSSKTSKETKERAKKDLRIANDGGLGKYLGLLEHFGRRKKDLFRSIYPNCGSNSTKGKELLNKILLKRGKDDNDQIGSLGNPNPLYVIFQTASKLVQEETIGLDSILVGLETR